MRQLIFIFCTIFASAIFTIASAQEDGAVADTSAVSGDGVSQEANVIDTLASSDVESADTLAQPARRVLDLDALLEDDDSGDLFAEFESDAQPTAANIDTANVEDSSLANGDTTAIDTTAIATDTQATPAQVEDETPATPRIVTAEAANIEDGRSINFAQNLQGYRSPRRAMLLSLLVPGLGQAYAKNYVKAAAFGAAELASIGVAIYFNYAANDKRDEAYRFADRHFDRGEMENYIKWVTEEFDAIANDSIRFPNGLAETVPIPYEIYDDFINAANGKTSYYYSRIGDPEFTPGWNDNEPHFSVIQGSMRDGTSYVNGNVSYELTRTYSDFPEFFYLITRTVDGVIRETNLRGYSSRQEEYNSMLDDSKSMRDAVNYTFYVMLVNRIVSAIDAGFTARAYNARLLEEETVFNRISLEQQYVFTGNVVSQGFAMRVRF